MAIHPLLLFLYVLPVNFGLGRNKMAGPIILRSNKPWSGIIPAIVSPLSANKRATGIAAVFEKIQKQRHPGLFNVWTGSPIPNEYNHTPIAKQIS